MEEEWTGNLRETEIGTGFSVHPVSASRTLLVASDRLKYAGHFVSIPED